MTKYDSEVADAHQNLQPVLQNIKELKCKVRIASSFSLVSQYHHVTFTASLNRPKIIQLAVI